MLSPPVPFPTLLSIVPTEQDQLIFHKITKACIHPPQNIPFHWREQVSECKILSKLVFPWR